MKKLILSLFILLPTFISAVQAQQVVSSGGAFFKGDNFSLSWTIGEPVIETLSNGSVILTQGFQQGYPASNSIEDFLQTGLNIQVYPNPVADNLNLLVKSDNYASLQFSLHDISGKALFRGSIISDLTNIDMNMVPHGVYLLRLLNKSGEPLQSFKVVKQ